MSSKIYQNYKITNNADKEFYSLMSYINSTEIDRIEKVMKRYLTYVKQRNVNLYEDILKSYNEYQYWGKLLPEKDIYEVINNRATALKNHQDNFIWLYNRLEDYRSKKCLFGIISHWLTFDPTKLENIKDNVYRHYFDLDIITCDENEVFIDIGAYTGDTVVDYISTYDNYKKIYCYEIVPEICDKLKKNLGKFDNIEFRQKGAHRNSGYMHISDNEPHESMHKLSDTAGKIKIPVVIIDEDISEPVTFIKMDIEGGEQNALWGCKKHIQTEQPKLAVSVYHDHEDIWKCAAIIDEIVTGYKFYLRYYGENIYPSEYVLLAVYES
jgi:FkbM family methyltransferase